MYGLNGLPVYLCRCFHESLNVPLPSFSALQSRFQYFVQNVTAHKSAGDMIFMVISSSARYRSPYKTGGISGSKILLADLLYHADSDNIYPTRPYIAHRDRIIPAARGCRKVPYRSFTWRAIYAICGKVNSRANTTTSA